ncbi:MAG: molybdate ABC transporter substrate-binding protein [Gammaproteobacteria bacterium]|nr:MAG: molybdate ABC transporter substrate-binding protein [Gammaproteobacteria bacterium]
MMKKRSCHALFLIVVAAIFITLYLVTNSRSALDKNKQTPELLVLSGAGLIKPVEEIVKKFSTNNGVVIKVKYGGSGELLGQLSLGNMGDVFIPGAEKYVYDAGKNGWIDESSITKLVKHIPVIAVPFGNPKKINGIEDLAGEGVVLAIGDVDACAIGRISKKIFKKSGLQQKVAGNIKVSAPTVNQLLMYVIMNQVDATIIWEDMVSWSESRQKLSVVEIDQKSNIIKTISAGVINNSPNAELSKKLVTFMKSPEGYEIWKKWGFKP